MEVKVLGCIFSLADVGGVGGEGRGGRALRGAPCENIFKCTWKCSCEHFTVIYIYST